MNKPRSSIVLYMQEFTLNMNILVFRNIVSVKLYLDYDQIL